MENIFSVTKKYPKSKHYDKGLVDENFVCFQIETLQPLPIEFDTELMLLVEKHLKQNN